MTKKNKRLNWKKQFGKLREKYEKKPVVLICVLALIAIVIGLSCLVNFLLFPQIQLNGDQVTNVEVGEVYDELGASATIRGQDISERLNIEGAVDTEKLGTYLITYSAQDGIFTSKKERAVNVIDTQAPIITLTGENTHNVCPSQDFSEPGYETVDNYDGDLTDAVKTEIKNDIVEYFVTDSSGNIGRANRMIVYEDKTPPTITLKGPDLTYTVIDKKYSEPGYIADDNCGGDITSNVEVVNNIDTSKLGRYLVTYKVKDSSGNEIQVERAVEVVKTLPTGIGKPGVVYLTFDDGPSPNITPAILDILKKRKIKATFFVINRHDSLDYLYKRIVDEGHAIAIHSSSHNYAWVYESVDSFWNDFNIISDKVKRLTGVKSKILRFIGGSSNAISANYSPGIMSYLVKDVLRKGYYYYDWNVDSGDAISQNTSADVYNQVTQGLSKNRGNIVLMHDSGGQNSTLGALNDIISYGLNNGYTFDKIDKSTEMVTHGVNN